MVPLTPAMKGFILHWGEMAANWGINRTVAQIHALLYLSPKPLHAEAITETLSMARSNVGNGLRELRAWGIAKVVHVLGDRRDHFETVKDVWQMFQLILDERRKREIDPTVAVLRSCVAKAQGGGAKDAYTHERLVEMLNLFTTIASWCLHACTMSEGFSPKFIKLGDKRPKVLGIAS
jgi:DNA-binding transcriptional regulator GbsR (MarR family)